MGAHYIKKIIIPCFACLLYTHQHGYGRHIFLRSASVTVVMQYDTWSNASLCRVVMPVHPANLKECKQTIFLSSEPFEHLFTVLACLFFELVDKSKNAAECSCMSCIVDTWRRIQNCFLDVADVMHSIRIKDPDKIAFVVEIWIACSKTR